MANAIDVKAEISEKDVQAVLQTLQDMSEAVDPKDLKGIIRRNSKPIERAMKVSSPSTRLKGVIGITSSKKKTGGEGRVKVGIIKNDPTIFKKISSFGLASILEHGTPERFRGLSKGILVVGRASTGKVEPDPFLRPSYDANIRGVIQKTEESVIKKVQKSAGN